MLRLVGLYTFDEAVVRGESGDLKQQRARPEDRLRDLHRGRPPSLGGLDPDHLAQVCAAIGAWLDQAGDTDSRAVN